MIGDRIHTISERDQQADYEAGFMLVPTARGKWRLYEDGTGYSQRSGIVIKRGKVVRDFDGRAVQLNTKEEAAEYARKLAAQEKADVERARAARAAKMPVVWKPAADGAKNFAGEIIQRPHCPQHGEMKWDGDNISYYCVSCPRKVDKREAAQ